MVLWINKLERMHFDRNLKDILGSCSRRIERFRDSALKTFVVWPQDLMIKSDILIIFTAQKL